MLPGRVLGIDLGSVRTGLAISDDMRLMAHPLETLQLPDDTLLAKIAAIASEREVVEVVIGLPRNMDGSHGPAADRARSFSEKLSSALPAVKIHLWDERLTTVAASKSLRDAGRSSRKQKSVVDQVAAQLILQGWLDATAR
jgi:putative Holliday junction resolvase